MEEHGTQEASEDDWHAGRRFLKGSNHVLIGDRLNSEEPKKHQLAEDEEAELTCDHVTLDRESFIEVLKRSARILILVLLVFGGRTIKILVISISLVPFAVIIFFLLLLRLLILLWCVLSLRLLSIVKDDLSLEPVQVSRSVEILTKFQGLVDADRSVEAITTTLAVGLEHCVNQLTCKPLLLLSLVRKGLPQLLVLFRVLKGVDKDLIGLCTPVGIVIIVRLHWILSIIGTSVKGRFDNTLSFTCRHEAKLTAPPVNSLDSNDGVQHLVVDAEEGCSEDQHVPDESTELHNNIEDADRVYTIIHATEESYEVGHDDQNRDNHQGNLSGPPRHLGHDRDPPVRAALRDRGDEHANHEQQDLGSAEECGPVDGSVFGLVFCH